MEKSKIKESRKWSKNPSVCTKQAFFFFFSSEGERKEFSIVGEFQNSPELLGGDCASREHFPNTRFPSLAWHCRCRFQWTGAVRGCLHGQCHEGTRLCPALRGVHALRGQRHVIRHLNGNQLIRGLCSLQLGLPLSVRAPASCMG